jgi:hypothetical protein
VNDALTGEPFPDTADSRAFQRTKRRRWIELGIAVLTAVGFCVMFGVFYSILTQPPGQ